MHKEEGRLLRAGLSFYLSYRLFLCQIIVLENIVIKF